MEPIFNLKEGGEGGRGGLGTSAWRREFVGMGLNPPPPENFEIYSSYRPCQKWGKLKPPPPLPTPCLAVDLRTRAWKCWIVLPERVSRA